MTQTGIYLIQRKDSVIWRCFLSFLAMYMVLFLIFFIPISIGAQGYWHEHMPFFKILSILCFMAFFPYHAMIALVALHYKCKDKVEFDSVRNTLLVNNIEHKILKTNAIKLMTSRCEPINAPNFASGILIFTLENNRQVCALSLYPKIVKYPDAFNFDYEGNAMYNVRSYYLMYSTLIISLALLIIILTQALK